MSLVSSLSRCMILLSLAGLLLPGCSTTTSQQEPTYVHVDSFSFNVASAQPGYSASHQITQVWAYYNNNPVGVFDLPATFPVITSGSKGLLELAPGITVDGLNDFLASYAFYSISTDTLFTTPGKVIDVTPGTGYYSDVKFTRISNFTGNPGFAPAGNYMPIAEVGGTDSYEGHNSGIIHIGAPTDTAIDSCRAFAIPSGTAFVEFNYKGTLQFYVGLQANQANVASSTVDYRAGIYPSAAWQKFYLNVSDFAAQYPATSYNLYLMAYCSNGLDSGTVLVNNFQLLSY